MISKDTIFILISLNLFIVGIKYLSLEFLYKFNIFNFSKRLNYASNYSIATIIGLFIFCIFANIILIIPSICFFLNNSINNFGFLISFSLNFLKLIFVIINFLGIFDLLKRLKFNKRRLSNMDKYNIDLITCLIFSSLIYLVAAPKSISNGIHFDTGLYHLPFINHISSFTIEPGLANLHFRYGYYGLSFFGQVPFQFFKNENYLSPSLNIGFLALYISYFMYFLRKISFINIYNSLIGMQIFEEKKNEVSILFFFLSICFYTGGIFKSLSSYSLDLPLFICGSLTFHLILLTFYDKNKSEYFVYIFWLSLFSPIVKLTGIITPIFTILFIYINYSGFILKKFKLYPNSSLNIKNISKIKSLFQYLYKNRPLINYRNSTIIVSIILITYITTNIITTGYPFFPKTLLGPLHEFSLESSYLEKLNIDILIWHRYQGKDIFSNYWVLYYLFTRNGLLNIIFWFIPSLFSFIFFRININKYKSLINLKNLYIPLLIIQLLCFFYLIPLVNYYPWITHSSLFIVLVLINRIIKFKKNNLNFSKFISYFLITFIVSNSFLSFANFKILKSIPFSFFREPLLENNIYETFEVTPKKWISLKNINNNLLKINIPKNSHQCWGIEPPCTFKKENLNKI